MFVQVAVAMHCAPQAWALKTKGLPEVYAISRPAPNVPHGTPYGVGDAIETPAVHYGKLLAYFHQSSEGREGGE
jgi:hypothetical protein